MQFMMMHKMNAEMEKGGPPDPEIMAGVGKLVEDAIKEGVFVSGEGLKPTAQRTHVAYKNGKRTVTEGPFTSPRELPAGFALLTMKSKEEALDWLDKFASVLGDVEINLGPIVEPWDMGFGPKPENAPLRYLSVHQADAHSESDAPPDAATARKMGALVTEMTAAGVLQSAGSLLSTKKGARIHLSGGKPTVIDGPFTESKELIAGYAIFKLPSKAEAIERAIRFGHIVKVEELEVREMAEF